MQARLSNFYVRGIFLLIVTIVAENVSKPPRTVPQAKTPDHSLAGAMLVNLPGDTINDTSDRPAGHYSNVLFAETEPNMAEARLYLPPAPPNYVRGPVLLYAGPALAHGGHGVSIELANAAELAPPGARATDVSFDLLNDFGGVSGGAPFSDVADGASAAGIFFATRSVTGASTARSAGAAAASGGAGFGGGGAPYGGMAGDTGTAFDASAAAPSPRFGGVVGVFPSELGQSTQVVEMRPAYAATDSTSGGNAAASNWSPQAASASQGVPAAPYALTQNRFPSPQAMPVVGINVAAISNVAAIPNSGAAKNSEAPAAGQSSGTAPGDAPDSGTAPAISSPIVVVTAAADSTAADPPVVAALSAVPEPSSIALAALGVALLLIPGARRPRV